MQIFVAFCAGARNVLAMAKREVVFSGFSGLFAFGVGVAVGANWPRASNFVGFVLQRLGLELTDLALWMWDPEKSAAQEAEITPIKRAKTKRAEALVIQDGSLTSKKVGSKLQAKKRVRPPGKPSSEDGHRSRRRKATNGSEPWIRSEGLNGSLVRANGRRGNAPLIESSKVGRRGGRTASAAADLAMTEPDQITVRTAARTQPRGAKGKAKRNAPASGRRRKISTFPGTIVAAEAALN